MSPYKEQGFNSLREYLEDLASDYGVPVENVFALAQLLGPDEDFDRLISAIEDMSMD